MSLVHQVLRDIDQRDAQAAPLPAGLTAPSTRAAQPMLPWVIALLVLVVALLMIVALQRLPLPADQSPLPAEAVIAADNKADVRVADVAPVSSVQARPESTSDQADSDLSLQLQNPERAPADKPARANSIETVTQALRVEQPMVVNDVQARPEVTRVIASAGTEAAEQPRVVFDEVANSEDLEQPAPITADLVVTNNSAHQQNLALNETSSNNTASRPKTVASVAVTPTNNIYQQRFRQALDLMQQQQWQDAQQQLQPLLQVDDSVTQLVRYRSAYLRTLVEQQLWSDVKALYLQYRQINAISWLSVAAPGLHMAGEYQLALPVYRQLMQRQPQQPSWPMALLYLYRQTNQPQAARQLLLQLQQYSGLSQQQRRWLQQQAKELTSP